LIKRSFSSTLLFISLNCGRDGFVGVDPQDWIQFFANSIQVKQSIWRTEILACNKDMILQIMVLLFVSLG